MGHEPEARDRGQRPGERLARLLRRWWEEAGSAPGGTRPTQQALASKLGIDQTTLSRYLNPRHASTAPPRVVEALHAHLRAPAAELERARELCRAVLEENSRAALEESSRAALEESSGHAPAGTGPRPTDAADAAGGTDGRAAPGRPGRSRWVRPALVAAVVVLAFAAGVVVRDQYAPRPRTAADGVAAGAVPASGAPLQWPLLRKRTGDQFTPGRALQHLLRAHGYEVRTDGFFGDETRDAVMDFQRRNNLPSDGKVGEDTWPELVVPLGRGADGHAVLALQELLHNAGQGGTEVSGEFTAATAEDLRFFQDRHGLRPSGRADADTWLALLVFQRPPVAAPAYQGATSPPPSTPA
ncbi:peptidoglycan-binding protein [Streptomyces sp. NPDC000348]|uniref:peptidoglycan-binding protein n=1 Tax=Streptomyces sp. NPDC000348 TaxID=3364538 RepID=UPI0036C68016